MDISLIIYLDFFGTVVFALSGAMVAGRQGMDFFGAVVLAMLTAVGGGTVRDLILGVPPFWTKDVLYIYLILGTCVFSYIYLQIKGRIRSKSVEVADALGLAAFTVIGAEKTLQLGFDPIIAVMMGIMTAVLGGMLRDVVSGRPIFVLSGRQFYATACLMGALILVILYPLLPHQIVIWLSFTVTLALRLAAMKYNLQIPLFPQNKDTE